MEIEIPTSSEEELDNICSRRDKDAFIEEYCDNDNLA